MPKHPGDPPKVLVATFYGFVAVEIVAASALIVISAYHLMSIALN